MYGTRACAKCGWTSEPEITPRRKEKDVLKLARTLLILSGIATVLSVLISLVYMPDESIVDEYDIPSDIWDTMMGIAACCMAIQVVGALSAFLTAYLLTLSNRRFAICLAGSAVAIVGIGPYYSASILALVALILIAISGDEFR